MGADKLADSLCDERTVFFKRKMPGIEEVKLEVRQVPLVGIRAFGGKDVVVCTPDNQGRGLKLPEIGLPFGIGRRVRSVVEEQFELNLLVALAIKELLIDNPGIGADRLGVPGPIGPLPLRHTQLQTPSQRRSRFDGTPRPIGAARVPTFSQPFLVSFGVLDD